MLNNNALEDIEISDRFDLCNKGYTCHFAVYMQFNNQSLTKNWQYKSMRYFFVYTMFVMMYKVNSL